MTVSTRQLTSLSVVLIAILLIVLGTLQYRWIGELSEFEGERMQRSLQAASERLQNDFERELDDLWRALAARRGDDVPGAVAAAYAEWVAPFSRFPKLVDAVLWVSAEPDTPEVSRLNALEGSFEASEWPEVLGDVRDEFARDVQRRRRGDRRGSYFTPLGADTLALIVTQTYRRTQSRAIVLLDRGVLVERLIPALLQEYVGGGRELDYEAWILDETDGRRVVYPSEPVASDPTNPDVQIDLKIPDHLDLRPDEDRRGHLFSVLLRHQAGSLEAAIEQSRRRNLLVSLGILALLGASVVLLAVTTRRAQSLADQQMEFVAGVSHELRTPITGISSLSQNLADGVVRNSDKVETYGKTIHRESRRLADMVERVLQFSALRSGKHHHQIQPLAVSELIDDAIDAVGPTLPNRFRFEQAVETPLPEILGDERGLKSAIQNLISNAMKFSEPGGLIRVSARAQQVGDGREVQVSIEDRGRGIPPTEQSRIFEPFFRGAGARGDQVQGSGLGLSLVKDIVQSQGGTVTLVSHAGRGSTFTLHLPVGRPDVQEAARDDRS